MSALLTWLKGLADSLDQPTWWDLWLIPAMMILIIFRAEHNSGHLHWMLSIAIGLYGAILAMDVLVLLVRGVRTLRRRPA